MENQSHSINKRYIQPNTESYNAVLEACKQSNDPNIKHILLDLMQRMEDHYEAGIVSAKPNRTSFSLLLTGV